MFAVTASLYRGERPKSFKDLQRLGVKTVINLQSGAHEFFNDDCYEREQANDFGMTEVNFYCSDLTPPSSKQIEKFLDIVQDPTRGVVYVHCLHGKDRTGFMIAVFRMQVQGWTYQMAKEELFRMGFHKFPYLFWLRNLRKWARS